MESLAPFTVTIHCRSFTEGFQTPALTDGGARCVGRRLKPRKERRSSPGGSLRTSFTANSAAKTVVWRLSKVFSYQKAAFDDGQFGSAGARVLRLKALRDCYLISIAFHYS